MGNISVFNVMLQDFFAILPALFFQKSCKGPFRSSLFLEEASLESKEYNMTYAGLLIILKLEEIKL